MVAGHTYDDFADEYAASVRQREQGGMNGDELGILPSQLDLLGDVSGFTVLDAGCGEGWLSRVLAARGAKVTAIDLSPRLIDLARERGLDSMVDYRVADLSKPLPEDIGCFDAVASYLVLNDVQDVPGFASTLAAVLKPGGRMVHSLNNPYGAVIRKRVADYFDSGAVSPYLGLWSAGIKTYYHHRTLEAYLDAFLTAGLQLTKLADLPARAFTHDAGTILPDGYRFPRFTLLAFTKPT